MADADIETLLKEISPEAPAGPDLSYDSDYLELERAATETPERQVGDSILPAEEPDWKDVAKRSRALLGRTKDLSVIMQFLRAELVENGIEGLRDGLVVLRSSIEQFWPAMHPLLDPEDGDDPTQRLNLIGALAPPPDAFSDTMGLRRRLRDAKLCKSARMGRFGLRDISVASGDIPGETGAPKTEMNQIDAAFEDTTTEELTGTLTAIDESIAEIGKLKAVLSEKVGAHRVPDFKPLIATLNEARGPVVKSLEKRGAAAPAAADGATDAADGATSAGVNPHAGEIRSTRDVIEALERICNFYEKYEPSSPIPLIIRRAQRLVSKSFMDIIKDLSPNAIDGIQMITGVEEPRT